METHFDRIVGIITQRDKFMAERDELARQLGEITATVAAGKHLPQRDTIAETIEAADIEFSLTKMQLDVINDRASEEIERLHASAQKYRERQSAAEKARDAAIATASQAHQETLREVAKAMGAEKTFEAMVNLLGAEKTTPECFAEMLRMCAASSPEEVALQFKAAKIEHPGILFTITEGDPFAGIMDGPEMMPTWDGPSDLGDVKMSAHCEGDDECPSCGSQWFIDPVCGDCDR